MGSRHLCFSQVIFPYYLEQIQFFKNSPLHFCDFTRGLMFKVGSNISSPLWQRVETFQVLILKSLFRFGHFLLNPYLPFSFFSPQVCMCFRDFHCHLSPVLNAICHVGKSPGDILMTGKCFKETESSFSAPILQGN